MILQVTTLVHPQYKSCTYLVVQPDAGRTVVIDPGFSSPDTILQALENGRLMLDFILLTHEHFDHVAGTDGLRQRTRARLVCSAQCSSRLTDPRLNLSAYASEDAVRVAPADLTVAEDDFTLPWSGISIGFLITPGHSPGGACILIGDWLFTGDTLLADGRSPAHLPGGDRAQLRMSHRKINAAVKATAQVYPGHGNPFVLGSVLPL